MRLFDEDHVGCYLDAIAHRVEKTKAGGEVKLVDLTLRVQPFTATHAVALDPDVRALIFRLKDGEPKPKIKKCEFALSVPPQRLIVQMVPEVPSSGLALHDAVIAKPRVRTEKGVDGFAFLCRVSLAALGSIELEYLTAWHTEQRFVTFYAEQDSLLDYAGKVALEEESHA